MEISMLLWKLLQQVRGRYGWKTKAHGYYASKSPCIGLDTFKGHDTVS